MKIIDKRTEGQVEVSTLKIGDIYTHDKVNSEYREYFMVIDLLLGMTDNDDREDRIYSVKLKAGYMCWTCKSDLVYKIDNVTLMLE